MSLPMLLWALVRLGAIFVTGWQFDVRERSERRVHVVAKMFDILHKQAIFGTSITVDV